MSIWKWFYVPSDRPLGLFQSHLLTPERERHLAVYSSCMRGIWTLFLSVSYVQCTTPSVYHWCRRSGSLGVVFALGTTCFLCVFNSWLNLSQIFSSVYQHFNIDASKNMAFVFLCLGECIYKNYCCYCRLLAMLITIHFSYEVLSKDICSFSSCLSFSIMGCINKNV